jgi:hypothetical protein
MQLFLPLLLKVYVCFVYSFPVLNSALKLLKRKGLNKYSVVQYVFAFFTFPLNQ